ncbi:MAG: glycosyltransferase family 1 protein [Candidatus Methylomirabilota bacterium]|nr:MAG: glycosyltransferase family 1 protein [candidate division NC10 bacterium]
MRIGVNLLPLFPGQIGGTEAYTTNLLTHLTAIDRQHAYYLFVARYNRDLFEAQFQRPKVLKVPTLSLQGLRYAERGPIRVAGSVGRRLPRLSRWFVHTVANAHMRPNIRRHLIDVWFCPLINLAPPHLLLPSVVSIPDLQPEVYPELFRKDLLEWYRRRYPASCRDATKIITFSEFSRATIIDRYGVCPEKVHVIPHGIDDEFLASHNDSALQAVKAKYGLPPEYAFYPAATWPHKNHSILLKALRLLGTKHGIRLPCVFTGVAREGHHALLRTAEELNLTDQIRLLGHIQKRDMPLLYRGATFLVFPTLFEGFGLPLLEAMASDCPVLCSNTTSIPEVVGDAALLFDPRDPDAIADAMRQILTDEALRRALVQVGRKRCRYFSWERSARETLKVLEEAASTGARSQRPSHHKT